jgi:hypothetical protein
MRRVDIPKPGQTGRDDRTIFGALRRHGLARQRVGLRIGWQKFDFAQCSFASE